MRRRPTPPEEIQRLADACTSAEDKRMLFEGMSAETHRAYDLWKAKRECEAPEYNIAMAERALRRMERVDRMTPALRRVVHEYGLEVVHVFLEHKVTQPSRMMVLIGAALERRAGLHDLFRGCGVHDERSIGIMIATVRNANLPSGQARFKLNKGPNARQNPIGRSR
jgi:hypothetical protein